MAAVGHGAGLPLQAWRLAGGRRCGLHGDDTTGGRCETCDRLAAGEVWNEAMARWELGPERDAAYWAARNGDER